MVRDSSTREHATGDTFACPDPPARAVVLLVDNSASMAGGPIEEVNASLTRLARRAAEDRPTASGIEVALVTCGGSVCIVRDFEQDATDTAVPDLTAAGTALIEAGLSTAYDLLLARRQMYRHDARACYRPTLAVITDPNSLDEASPTVARISDAADRGRLVFTVVGWDGANALLDAVLDWPCRRLVDPAQPLPGSGPTEAGNSVVRVRIAPEPGEAERAIAVYVAPEPETPLREEDAAPEPAAPAYWGSIAVSLTGSGHRDSAKPCQDTSLAFHPTDDAAFLVVSDGAGSAANSHYGSQTAVAAVRAHIEEIYRFWSPADLDGWKSLLGTTLTAARQSLLSIAAASTSELHDLACTLLVIGADATGIYAAGIGDCGALYGGTDGRLHTLYAPENGEHINETYFMTQRAWVRHAHFSYGEHAVDFALAFSDGLQFTALSQGKPFRGFALPLMEQLRSIDPVRRTPALCAYLQEQIIGSRTDDDVSIAALWREGD